MKTFLISFFSMASLLLGAQTVCFSYDAAGNRFNRNDCTAIMSAEEKKQFNDLMLQQGLDIRSEMQEVDLANIIVYPNPTSGAFRLLDQHKLGGAKIAIFANDGKLVENITVAADDIDVSHLPAGQYFMTLQFQNQRKTTKLIITK